MQCCKNCGDMNFEQHMNRLRTCVSCGVVDNLGRYFESYISPCAVLYPAPNYTRRKRFRKYLARCCMKQTLGSVPDDTWKYLHTQMPLSGPTAILRALKRSKLIRKCFLIMIGRHDLVVFINNVPGGHPAPVKALL